MEKLRERIQWHQEKRPIYQEVLDFYQKIREEQEKTKTSLRIDPGKLRKECKGLFVKESLPPPQRLHFPLDLDIETSMTLFHSLCRITRDVNPYLSDQARKIEEILDNKRIDLKGLLKKAIQKETGEQFVEEFGLNGEVFRFLIQNSVKPLIEAVVEQFRNEFDPGTWLKGYCPICGSLPCLSILTEKMGNRLLLCSHCGYQWRIDRLICPYCNNTEQDSLHYFYGEGEELCRIPSCEKCHLYIKTIDLRSREDLDPSLEDLASFHLDILALQRGYMRPCPNPYWTIQKTN
ncbi:MAG: formate dehydrogenase accessory protein FdhE [Nitrospirae bacterium]|nr:formate dehydrogenase accessory protein FdhE [Nitrospirota bacterium]